VTVSDRQKRQKDKQEGIGKPRPYNAADSPILGILTIPFGEEDAPRGSTMVYCWVERWYVPIGCQSM